MDPIVSNHTCTWKDFFLRLWKISGDAICFHFTIVYFQFIRRRRGIYIWEGEQKKIHEDNDLLCRTDPRFTHDGHGLAIRWARFWSIPNNTAHQSGYTDSDCLKPVELPNT